MTQGYRLTVRAESDLRNIGRYSREAWGKPQSDKYLQDLVGRFDWLSKNPRLGTHRPDIEYGYYCFPQGTHLVFYLIQDDGIDIIGVPHKAMDIESYFDSD